MKSQVNAVYGYDFYTGGEDDPYDSPRAVVPAVCYLLHPKRVLDVGCGIGIWLSVFREYGVDYILGIDGFHVDPKWLRIPKESFKQADLSCPLELNERFDLAVCLEVAEHLPPRSADGLLDLLTKSSPCVLFSAAIPLQGGVEHVNERWPEYWHAKFQERDFRKFDVIRGGIWANPKVRYWYRQNIFLYAHAPYVPTNHALAGATFTADDLMLIHRDIFEAHFRLRQLLRRLPSALVEFTKNQWAKLRRSGP